MRGRPTVRVVAADSQAFAVSILFPEEVS